MDVRTEIIKPSLIAIGLWSQPAEDLLWGTGLQESGYKYTRQIGGGPALGYWQMEPFTNDDIWKTYLRFRVTLADKVMALGHLSAELETNHQYACAMARIKYLRSPTELPKLGDVRGYALAWKRIYNSAGGAGTVEEFIANYQRGVSMEAIAAQ
jgi:hypothetical protein